MADEAPRGLASKSGKDLLPGAPSEDEREAAVPVSGATALGLGRGPRAQEGLEAPGPRGCCAPGAGTGGAGTLPASASSLCSVTSAPSACPGPSGLPAAPCSSWSASCSGRPAPAGAGRAHTGQSNGQQRPLEEPLEPFMAGARQKWCWGAEGPGLGPPNTSAGSSGVTGGVPAETGAARPRHHVCGFLLLCRPSWSTCSSTSPRVCRLTCCSALPGQSAQTPPRSPRRRQTWRRCRQPAPITRKQQEEQKALSIHTRDVSAWSPALTLPRQAGDAGHAGDSGLAPHLQGDPVLDQQADLDVHEVEVLLELLIGPDLPNHFLLELQQLGLRQEVLLALIQEVGKFAHQAERRMGCVHWQEGKRHQDQPRPPKDVLASPCLLPALGPHPA